jgi:o-succinylbenzoate---CoA ligase
MFLHFNQISYSFAAILKKKWLQNSHTASELDILQFCYDWLSGKEAFVLHTSGSTGIPKPIKLLRKQMQASVAMTAQALQLTNFSDSTNSFKVLICLNTAYIGGKMMLTRGLELNWEMYVVPPTANPLINNFKVDFDTSPDIYFDFMAFVPLQLETILSETPEKINMLLQILNRTKAIIVGGAGVSASLKQKIQAIVSPVFLTYGMTETVSHIALQLLNGENKTEYFKILPEVQIRTNSQNCLLIKSPTTQNIEITTNDVVQLIDNERFILIGRADNVINSGGVKIQLEKVENILENIFFKYNIFSRFYAYGLDDEHLGKKLVVFVENKEPFSEILEKQIFEELKTQLPRYEVPKQFLYISKFHETDSGKVKRKNYE